jgi:hypothetical protein
MPSSGPNYASVSANDPIGGFVPWANLSNATGAGNWGGAGARSDVDKSVSEFLKLTGYGFSIPTGATIDGIQVEVSKGFFSGSNAGTLSAIMYKAGSQVGTSKNSTGFAPETFGSPTDLWGTTWTPAEINASGFGFGLSSNGGANGVSVVVSGARITVHYTDAGGGGGSDFATFMFHPF